MHFNILCLEHLTSALGLVHSLPNTYLRSKRRLQAILPESVSGLVVGDNTPRYGLLLDFTY